MKPTIPKNFGPYQLLAELGRGGMGVVYKAYNPALNKICALKILVPEEDTNPQSLQRFIAETRIASTLPDHPNIVAVQGTGEIGGAYFIAMDYVEGVEFSTITKHQRLPANQLYDILTPLSNALSQLHKHGIVHRDLKPSNVMINQNGHPLIMDFGIAKELARNTELTRSGTFVGTLGYMSPEQADNAKAVDHRADIYSLGAILYEALTGRPPHVGASATKILVSLISRDPPAPSSLNPNVDKVLEQICLKALQKEPEHRFRSMDEFNNACLRKTVDVASIPLVVRTPQAPPPPELPPQNFGALGPPPPGFDPTPSPQAYPAPSIPAHPPVENSEAALFETFEVEPEMGVGPNLSPNTPTAETEDAPKNLLTRSPEEMAASAKGRNLLIGGVALLVVVLATLAFIFSNSEEAKPQENLVQVNLEDVNLVDEQWLNKSPVELKGVLSAAPFQLTVNGQTVAVNELKFSHLINLKDGSHSINVVAQENEEGEAKSLTQIKIHVDTVAPQIKIEPIPSNTSKALLRVRGEVNDRNAPVLVNGQDSMIDSSRFSALIKLSDGENEIRIVARDEAGNEHVILKSVQYQPTTKVRAKVEVEPVGVQFELDMPSKKWIRTQEKKLKIRGRFAPEDAIVSINDVVMKTEDRLLDWTASLTEGKNEFLIKVQYKGAKKTVKLQVVRDSKAPELTIAGVNEGQLLNSKSVQVRIQSNEALKELLLNDKPLKIEKRKALSLNREVQQDGKRVWRFVATDLAGNQTVKVIAFKIDTSPPTFLYKRPKFLPKSKSLNFKFRVVEPHLISLTMQKPGQSKPEALTLSSDKQYQVSLKSAELRRGVKFCATDKLGFTKTMTARSELSYIYDLKAWNSLKKKELRKYEALEVQRLLGADKFSFLSLEKYYCRRAWSYIATYKHKSGLIFRLIPGSAWTFGFDNNSKEKRMEEAWINYKRTKDLKNINTESPRYSAQIAPFLMSATEITVSEYYTLANQNIPKDKRLRQRFPIIKSWTESASWCKKLGFRLPSEAEWEYACRAGTKTRYFWGQELDKKAFQFVWVKFNSGPRLRQPRMHMESKSWNAFGLVDMLGNAEEWCQDYWYSNYGAAPSDGRPRPLLKDAATDSKHYKQRPSRGGMYASSQFSIRIGRRNSYHYLKNDKAPITGIRAVVPLPEQAD